MCTEFAMRWSRFIEHLKPRVPSVILFHITVPSLNGQISNGVRHVAYRHIKSELISSASEEHVYS